MMELSQVYFLPFMMGFALIGIVIALLVLAFWIWMIVDCAKRNFKKGNEKIIWLLVIVFGQWIGALIYFIVVRQLNPKGLIN